jgi:hypothetical protein
MIAADRARVVCSPLHCDRTITPSPRTHKMAPIAFGSLPTFANTMRAAPIRHATD